jgi:DNA-binding XRE family transcriptional regulator
MKIANHHNHDRIDSREAALTLAVAVLVERIRSLSKEDKEDLFAVSKALFTADNEEEVQSAVYAFQEILDQKGAHLVQVAENDSGKLASWLSFVGKRIKMAREDARMTQAELELASGLPQSHISRLENGVHSPSSTTLEKIAQATNKPLSYFDPSVDGDG